MKLARPLATAALSALLACGGFLLGSSPAHGAPAPHAAGGGSGALTVTKAELKGTTLRLEGHTLAGTSFVAVESTTSAVSARPDGGGVFKAQSNTFTAPDCRVTVRDFRNPAQTITLSGCTPSVTPVSTPAPPTGRCVLTPQPVATTLTAGAPSVFWFYATGCATDSPLQYTVVGGAIPTGMTVGGFQTASSGNIIGTPSVRGSYRFTIQITDSSGATDQENFSVTVS